MPSARTRPAVLLALAACACGRTEAPPSAPAKGAGSTALASPTVERALQTAVEAEPDAAPELLPEAAPEPASRAVTPSSPDMLPVPAGSFTMGADTGGQEDEHPAHIVTLPAFYLDVTEVTNAAWDECVAVRVCRPKSEAVRSRYPDLDGPMQPVSGISWDDARTYCEWRGKRLPREAEFERAVRGDDDRRFPWGNEPPTHDKAVFASSRTEDVATHSAGRGPYGQEDLAGNVWEWMADEYDPYAYRRAGAGAGLPGSCPQIMAALDELRREHKQGFTGSNPIPEECEHSIRGGAYNYDVDGLRSTNRVHHPSRFRIPMLGLRCAKDDSP